MLKIVITDLDGTLANPYGKISKSDLNTLKQLGEKNIIRVIATGRSLYSANKVLDENLPIDYLLFSSGAGILNWPNKEIIKNSFLSAKEIQSINTYLMDINTDFMLHLPIPENHKFLYHKSERENPDFMHRIEIYNQFSEPINTKKFTLKTACQYVVIEPDETITYEQITKDLKEFSVIRTTSPLDKETLWIEIFPPNVSKGQSTAWLCDRLSINQSDVLSIGNDYNDLDLLEWSGYSFVVENAPSILKKQFDLTKSNHESALMHAVHLIINL